MDQFHDMQQWQQQQRRRTRLCHGFRLSSLSSLTNLLFASSVASLRPYYHTTTTNNNNNIKIKNYDPTTNQYRNDYNNGRILPRLPLLSSPSVSLSSSRRNARYARAFPPGFRLFSSHRNHDGNVVDKVTGHSNSNNSTNNNNNSQNFDGDENDDDDDEDDEDQCNNFATVYHNPVMVAECIDALLNCQRGRRHTDDAKDNNDDAKDKDDDDDDPPPPLIFVDGTLGGGGHAAALLARLRPGDVLLGCDVDPQALHVASERLARYMDHPGTDRPLFLPVRSNFGDLATTLPTVVHPRTHQPILLHHNDVNNDVDVNDMDVHGQRIGVDGILLDLGVSSHQIDKPGRGFSFMRDGPLDMRMGNATVTPILDTGRGIEDTSNKDEIVGGSSGLTASDICNEFDVGELQRIFSEYGDEPKSKTIAKAIVNHRPLSTTHQLVAAIGSVTPKFAKNKRRGRTATCARIFQALRIVVNNEDGVLHRVLSVACPQLLRPGGRLVVLSYHSMEDRATKRIMRDGTLDNTSRQRINNDEKDVYGNYCGPPKPFKPTSKRRKASEDETSRNSRARSAILRIAERQDTRRQPGKRT